jgi:hypothetical protein
VVYDDESVGVEAESGNMEKAEGWKDALAGVYGEDGPEPDMLEVGERIPPVLVSGIDGGCSGSIARRKSDDCAEHISTARSKAQADNVPADLPRSCMSQRWGCN